ncbi:uncharacterized protein N7496_012627 [Penicillium cataractarum]|uniref:Terpene synthase n=1 Tax=Penicillium cataractarum TaxID=2100454 RepID=A0A9W9R820_9EURO|nr:uncharacterized protein N7496_012627 [Penicillium cataractarum]KAJ5355415.1 hypothetical protein N7496_012627 [Penicillium cataractarum]
MTEQSADTPHQAFRESLEGQIVTIPSIYKLLPEWQPNLHEDYERAREEELDPWIRRWVPDERTARSLCAADFGRFAGVWVPGCQPYRVLCTAAKYFAWYFVYDDIFDCGSLKHDQQAAETYRQASLQYFNFTLLGKGDQPDLSQFDDELQKALHCWDEVGEHIREVCSEETREVLCDEMLRYVGSLNNIDSIFRENEMPSVEEYWSRREATAAVYCVVATVPFIYGVDIQKSDVNIPAMRDLWKHTSYFVHISNDMFSLRKELADDQIENLVPVLMLNRGIDCNTAMQQSYELLHATAKGLQRAESNLSDSPQQVSPKISTAFVQGCFDTAMGLAHWSYCGARYFKPSEREDGHVIKFTIQGHKRQKDDMISTKEVQKTAGLATWYRFLPFGVLLIAPKIYSLVASTTLRWVPRGWIGIWSKSPSH